VRTPFQSGARHNVVALPAYPLYRAALAQLGGLAAVILIIWGMVRVAGVDPAGVALALAMLQGGVAAMIALKQSAPLWWIVIHLAFAPLLLLVHRLDIAPGWFLAGFVLLLLVFWRTDRSRVPLFLSNRQTAEVIAGQVLTTPCRFLDIGCGDGGLLVRLAAARPDCHFTGVEHAPIPWLIAWLRTRRISNATVRYGDFWRTSLAEYDMVYAFLSPAPMQRLWEKARAEMKPGALLVSNSFTVPEARPMRSLRVKDKRMTRLFLYQPSPNQSDKAPDSAAFQTIPDAQARQ